MICVGIDPSLTSSGVAILQDGQPATDGLSHHGYKGFKGMDWDARADRAVYVHNRIIERIPAGTDLVVLEDIPEHGQIMPSMRDRAFLWGLLYSTLRKIHKLPVAVMNPMTLKVWATGQGRADKSDMVAAVHDWFPGLTKVDDEADAVCLALAGSLHLGAPMPFDVRERHHTALEKTLWPVIA